MSNITATAPIPSMLSHEKLSNDAVLQQLLKEVGLAEDDMNMEPLNAIVTDTDSLYDVDSITPKYSFPDTVPIESPLVMPDESAGRSWVVDIISLDVPNPLKPRRQLSSSCEDPIEALRQDKNLVTILPKPIQLGMPVVAWTAAASAVPRKTPRRPPPRYNAITEQDEKRYIVVFWLDDTKVTTNSSPVIFKYLASRPLLLVVHFSRI
jgi:hypothetical protein